MIASSDVATESAAEAALKAQHVKRSRALHEVTAAVLYSLLRDKYESSDTSELFESWCQREAENNPSFKFWFLILNLQSLLFTFVHSIREGKFKTYVDTLKQMIPWFFVTDHHHYARWLPVHARDLEELPNVAPALYEEFLKGKFVVRKTNRKFSSIAVDQAHEQNNAVIKDAGGMVGLTHDPSMLRRITIAGPEICRVMAEFNELMKKPNDSTLHHEQYHSFQENFKENCIALKEALRQSCDPFGDQEVLVAIDTGAIVDKDGVDNLYSLEKNGRLLYETYVTERLVTKCKSVFAKIPKVGTRIFVGKKKPIIASLETAKYFKSEAELFSRLFVVVQNRNLDMNEFFSHENQSCPPSLSKFGCMNKPSNKYDIVHMLEDLLNVDEREVPSSCDGIIYDGAAMVHATPPRQSSNYQEYCQNEFRLRISQDVEKFNASRVDLVWDMYKADSLKNATRDGRGPGTRRQVSTHFFDAISTYLILVSVICTFFCIV